MPDEGRSTGVQQGAYERGVEDGWAWARGGPEPEGVGAVSPEHPRKCHCPECVPEPRRPARQALRPFREGKPWTMTRGYSAGSRPASELGTPPFGPEPKVEANRELSRDDETNPTTTTSVARELRLTASRLRDPEYHWYEHAAVTLERLAEKLEKGRDDG